MGSFWGVKPGMAAKKRAAGERSRQPPESCIEFALFYCGQGNADWVKTVSSGKLKAPSIALDVGPISNHCSRGMTWGW